MQSVLRLKLIHSIRLNVIHIDSHYYSNNAWTDKIITIVSFVRLVVLHVVK